MSGLPVKTATRNEPVGASSAFAAVADIVADTGAEFDIIAAHPQSMPIEIAAMHAPRVDWILVMRNLEVMRARIEHVRRMEQRPKSTPVSATTRVAARYYVPRTR
jgi:hypothetical protein